MPKNKNKKWNTLHLFLYHRLIYVIIFVIAFIMITGIIVTLAEQTEPRANIQNIPDGIWWAFSTATTVGYGDYFPKTTIGRTIAVSLMFVGFALFSIVTANIASFFVEKDEEAELNSLHDRIDELEKKIDILLETSSASRNN